MLLDGHIENGQIVLDEPANLPDGLRIRVELVPAEPAPLPTLFERLKPVIGIAANLPEDAALNHDHYLYGTPKKT